jgi:hypothetical protein
MPTTFEEALEYFIRYGGLCGPKEEMIRLWPYATCGQLRDAASHALVLQHRPKEEVDRALLLLIWK